MTLLVGALLYQPHDRSSSEAPSLPEPGLLHGRLGRRSYYSATRLNPSAVASCGLTAQAAIGVFTDQMPF